jgi:hypothetical protein
MCCVSRAEVMYVCIGNIPVHAAVRIDLHGEWLLIAVFGAAAAYSNMHDKAV